MIDEIKDLLLKYNTLKKMNKISQNGCSNDDYIYHCILTAKANTLDFIIADLKDIVKRYDIDE